jgi:dihydrofolate synthase/folylpolyglutamate synthase
VLAVSADKDVDAVVAALAGVDAVIATRYRQPRSLAPEALAARVAAHGVAVETAPDVVTAIARGRVVAGGDGVVVVAGSLFAVGEARVHLLDAPADPYLVTDPAPPR